MTMGSFLVPEDSLVLQILNIFFTFGEHFSLDIVSRRLEELKLEGLGFSQVEIVNELSQKLSCSKRVVYKDFETRQIGNPPSYP